jgi:hypothetical protein
MHYRIKIEERNDGTKGYIPQTAKLDIKGGWIKRAFVKWENILMDDNIGRHQTSNSMAYIYDSEEKALDAIESYKKYLSNEHDKSIKSVTYKNLN